MLHYVAFAALPQPEGNGYLIEQHEIVTIASVLAYIRKQSTSPEQKLFLMADPVFSSSDPRVKGGSRPSSQRNFALFTGNTELGRLPGTRREAERILLPQIASRSIFDFSASRSTLLESDLRNYRYVHIATHGFFNNYRPEFSGLVLSLVDENGNERNGFLLAPDIFSLQTQADLVVLSACETGLSRIVRGEGIVGITRGFFHAGAKRVLVSLWPVSDEGTAELMSRMYRQMLKRGLSPASALRNAQLHLLRSQRYSSPYYWALFVLQGEYK